MTNSNGSVEIALGASGESLEKKYPSSVTVSRQPAGLSFYKLNWTSNNKGTVRLVHGKHGVTFENVLHVLGTEDDSDKSAGINEFYVVCGITGPNGISDAEARTHIFSVIEKLKLAGWKSTIPFSSPRLFSKDVLSFMLVSGEDTTLSADYQPTLEEWVKLENLSTWAFYADGTFIDLSFTRDQILKTDNGRSAYVINLKIRTDEEYYRSFVAPDQRENWRALLPSAIEESTERRQQLEQIAIKKGFKIDSSYTDPPLPR